MKWIMFVAVLGSCAGCGTVEKYRGVSKEYNDEGKTIRHVETESIRQNQRTTETIKFKNL